MSIRTCSRPSARTRNWEGLREHLVRSIVAGAQDYFAVTVDAFAAAKIQQKHYQMQAMAEMMDKMSKSKNAMQTPKLIAKALFGLAATAYLLHDLLSD